MKISKRIVTDFVGFFAVWRDPSYKVPEDITEKGKNHVDLVLSLLGDENFEIHMKI